MICEPYSIVVVPFPFADKAQEKRRPALVISNTDFQVKTAHVTLLMITSAKHSHWDGDVSVVNLKLAGLSVPSVIRQKLFTIDISLIVKKIGILSKPEQDEVHTRLLKHLALK